MKGTVTNIELFLAPDLGSTAEAAGAPTRGVLQVAEGIGSEAVQTVRKALLGGAPLPLDVIERVIKGVRSGGRHRDGVGTWTRLRLPWAGYTGRLSGSSFSSLPLSTQFLPFI